ncbi:MAG: aminoglycoside phosphotransferase family protein [Kordiimonadaceae bacterium]|nr:aminoglycoside phosphotransferase family protein [Kordiimonadaceae bacterium]MBO6567162.1 aminoglycoside phosphotransferase family protein [Kordiimonadaceae bacterium]MBO6963623.1 aminoglycoside phosphotransferase family protein [Kordiimonadaceae bacterium]
MSDPKQILANMPDALERVGHEGIWRITSQLKNSRKCDIYLAANPSTSQKLALKIFRPGGTSEQAPGLQFRALERLQKATPRVLAPKVFGFSSENNAILMEWIEAETIQATLWRSILVPSKRKQAVQKAGAWLRQFHEVSHIALQPLDGNKLAQKLVTQLQKHGQTTDFDAIQQSIGKFEAAAKTLDMNVPHALLHGDFTVRNVLMQSGSTVGIDIWGARMGPVFEDAARFVTYAAINTPFALSHSPWHPDGPLSQSFATGYGKDLLDVRCKSWTLLMWYQFMRRWIVYSARQSKGNSVNLTRWQVKRAEAGSLILQSWLEDCF